LFMIGETLRRYPAKDLPDHEPGRSRNVPAPRCGPHRPGRGAT
jgi:hypothetical protein